MTEKHPGHETRLRCASCCTEFSNARSAGRHKCAGEPAPHNEVAMVRLTEDSAIYSYPPGPSQCPLCTWVSQAKDTAAVTSIEKHLMRSHQMDNPRRMWRCRVCNTIADGIKMRTHICNTQGTPSPTPTQPTNPTPTNGDADGCPVQCSQPTEGVEEFMTPTTSEAHITAPYHRIKSPGHTALNPPNISAPSYKTKLPTTNLHN